MKKFKSTYNDNDLPALPQLSDEEMPDQHIAVLHIVGKHVVKYLSSPDLKMLKSVCKTWKKAASDEEEIRIFQVMRLSVEFHRELKNMIAVFPYTSLLLFDSGFEKNLFNHLPSQLPWYDQRVDGLHRLLLEEYERLPNEIFTIGGDTIICDLEQAAARDIVGIFLPRLCHQVPVQIFAVLSAETGGLLNVTTRNGRLNAIVEELGVKAGDTYDATILIFTVNKSEKLSQGLEAKFERLRSDGNLRVVRLFVSRIFGRFRGVVGDYSTLIIKLGDSRIRVWNTEINYRSDRKEINEKLKELESKIIFNENKKYLGYLNSLKCIYTGCNHQQHPCGDSDFMMLSVKELFPYVTFINIFKNVSVNEYSSTSKYNELKLGTKAYWKALRNKTRIVIISY